MPTVPKDDRVVPFRPQPSETDLMMALATMKDLGRIPMVDRLDSSLQGQVEDRREVGTQEAEEARIAAAKRTRTSTLRPADQILKEFDKMKTKRRDEYESASTGVQGGSR